jgi:hypothetical protein
MSILVPGGILRICWNGGVIMLIWLDPPVISRDGDTLKIMRNVTWGVGRQATCLFMSAWLTAWAYAEYRVGKSVLFNIPDGHKGPPGLFGWIWLLFWSYAGLIHLSYWSRMVFLGGEEISIDSRELRVSHKWADNWKPHCYPLSELSNPCTGRRWPAFVRYSIRFDFPGGRIWLEPNREEPDHWMILNALQEHLEIASRLSNHVQP